MMRHACAWAAVGDGGAGGGAGLAPEVVAQDKPIHILDTEPAPAQIVGGTYFLVGGLVAAMVRNRHTAPVQLTLRAWVFDQSGRLKGTNAFCIAELLERGTRRMFNSTLEVRDLLSTDAVTVSVERVVPSAAIGRRPNRSRPACGWRGTPCAAAAGRCV